MCNANNNALTQSHLSENSYKDKEGQHSVQQDINSTPADTVVKEIPECQKMDAEIQTVTSLPIDIPGVKEVEQEMDVLQQLIAKKEEGSVERLLLEIKLELKKESCKNRKIAQQVITSNTLMQEELSSIQREQTIMNTQINQIQGFQNDNTANIKTNTESVKSLNKKVAMLQEIVENQKCMIGDLNSKQVDSEAKLMQQNVFIAGVDEPIPDHMDDEDDEPMAEML